MPTFDVTFQIIVAGLGTRTVTVNGIVTADAAEAIATARSTLVQVTSIGVVRTAV